MQGLQFVSVLIIIAATIFTFAASIQYSGQYSSLKSRICMNRQCAPSCEASCKYGVFWNKHCRFEECAMGPGSFCTQSTDMIGDNCGSGLRCNKCGRCQGCSSKQIGEPCFDDGCSFRSISQDQDLQRQQRRQQQLPQIFELYDWIAANNVKEV